MSRKAIVLSTLMIFSLLVACNLPGSQSKELFPSPTPDLTTTALVAQATLLTQQAPVLPSATAAAPLPPAPPAQPSPPPVQPPAQPPAAPTAVPNVPIVPITVVPPTAVPPTSLPTVVPVVPTQRPPTSGMVRAGDLMYAKFLTTPPVIDGIYEEWGVYKYNIGFVNYGAQNWTGAADLSGDFQVAWDDNYLYLSIRAADDVYVQQAAGADIYKGDSVELLFDRDLYGDFYTTSLSADDFQLGLSAGNPNTAGKKEAYLWFPRTIEGSRTANIAIASSSAAGSYVLEAAIPWAVLETKPQQNMGYGFVVSLSDNDTPSTAVQQTLITTAKNRSLVNPASWTELILIK